MLTSTVSDQGQTTVPASVRKALKAPPGTVLAWAVNGATAEVVPLIKANARKRARIDYEAIIRGVFHLTHRCHNRAFLLKFARDRNAYRAKLREHLQQHEMGLLDDGLTCNHVHLLVDAPERAEISA